MKLLGILLAASLALNAALAVLARRGPPSDSGQAAGGPDGVGASGAPATAKPVRATAATGKAGAATPALATAAGSRWADLHSADLAVFIARLRAAGLPPGVVRALLHVEIEERFAARERELYASLAYVPPWRPRPLMTAKAMAERDAAFTALNKEREDLLQQLLGADYIERDGIVGLFYRRQFGDLGPERMEKAQALVQAQAAALREFGSHFVATADGVPVYKPEEREKRRAIDEEFRTQLAQLLTPQELERYDLWSSETAQNLRSRLQVFDASEQEFLALYRLTRPIDDRYSQRYGALPADQAAARKRAEAEAEEQIKAALGPERYADYRQATAPEHATLNAIVSRLGLPLATARTVAGLQADIAQRAVAIRADAALPAPQREAQLAALTREAETRLQETLGPRGLDAFRQYNGAWLRTLPAAPSR